MKKKSCAFAFLILFVVFSYSFVQAQSQESKIFTMEECIQMTLKTNPDLISAENYYKSAKNSVWTAWGNFLPTVGTDLGYRRTKTGPSSTPGTGEGTTKGYSAGISASMDLFNLSNVFALYRANALKNSGYDNYVLAKQNLIVSVKQSYLELLKAKMLLEIQKDAVQRGEQQLKIAQSRYELGSASLSDVLKAKVQYGNEKLALIVAQDNVKLSQAKLNALIGRDINLPLEVEDVLVSPEINYTYETALGEAMQNNYEYKKAYQDLRAAKHNLKMAVSNWLPTLSLGYDYSWSNENLDMLGYFWKKDYDRTIRGSLNFNIFNGFQNKTATSNAKLDARYAQENYRQTKENVGLEVKNAYLTIQQAKEKLGLTGESVRSAKEDLDLVQEKYNLGAATMLELLDAEVSFKQAKSDEVQALFDYNLAFARLEKGMGR
jgi:outer membrane protein